MWILDLFHFLDFQGFLDSDLALQEGINFGNFLDVQDSLDLELAWKHFKAFLL